MSELSDADLVRWAAEFCGWTLIDAAPTMASAYLPPCRSAVAHIDLRCKAGVASLMADLLKQYVEATPEPMMVDGPPMYELRDEWNEWYDEYQVPIRAAITEGPLAVIRAIHQTEVLSA